MTTNTAIANYADLGEYRRAAAAAAAFTEIPMALRSVESDAAWDLVYHVVPGIGPEADRLTALAYAADERVAALRRQRDWLWFQAAGGRVDSVIDI